MLGVGALKDRGALLPTSLPRRGGENLQRLGLQTWRKIPGGWSHNPVEVLVDVAQTVSAVSLFHVIEPRRCDSDEDHDGNEQFE